MASLSEKPHNVEDAPALRPRDERSASVKSEDQDQADTPLSKPLPPEQTFPEGGLWGWASIASGWLYLFVTFGASIRRRCRLTSAGLANGPPPSCADVS